MDIDSVFEPHPTLEAFRSAPRAGHGKDITQILSSDKSEQLDYVYGVLFLAIILIVILIVWLIILATLSCLGSPRVGFLSGHHFTQPENKSGRNTRFYRPTIVRIIFLTFSLLVLASCGLLVTKGSDQYDETVASFQNSTIEITKLVNETNDVSKSLIRIGEDAQRVRADAVIGLENFCPNIDLEQELGVDLDIEAIIDSLGDLSDFVVDQATTARDQMLVVGDGLNTADEVLEQVVRFKGSAWYIVLPVAVLTTILIAGTLLAAGGCTGSWIECIQTQIVMRLLLLVSVVFWIAGGAFVIIAMLNADLCSGGSAPGNPDGTVFDVLDRFNIQETEPEMYEILRYYTEGCKTADPFDFLNEYHIELDKAMVMINGLLDTVDEISEEQLAQACGSSVSTEIGYVRFLDAILNELSDDVDEILGIINCTRINSIYRDAIHTGICSNLPIATSWVFAFLLVIGVCGMMMVSLRASWLEAEYAYHDNDEEVDVETFIKDAALDGSIQSPYRGPQSVNDSDQVSQSNWAGEPEVVHYSDKISHEDEQEQDLKANESSNSWVHFDTSDSYRDVEPVPPDSSPKTPKSPKRGGSDV